MATATDTPRRPTPVRIDSITDLLATIEALPAEERSRARRRVDAALDGPASQARAALGLLALDLAGALRGTLSDRSEGTSAGDPEVIVLPELVAADGRAATPAVAQARDVDAPRPRHLLT
jgi:hypothetical protein